MSPASYDYTQQQSYPTTTCSRAPFVFYSFAYIPFLSPYTSHPDYLPHFTAPIFLNSMVRIDYGFDEFSQPLSYPGSCMGSPRITLHCVRIALDVWLSELYNFTIRWVGKESHQRLSYQDCSM